MKKITIFGLIGLIVAFLIGFGGCSSSNSRSSEAPFSRDWSLLDNPSEHAPYPAFHRVKIPSELEGKIEVYYNWNQKIEGEGTDYEHKSIWSVAEIKNLSEWPITAVNIQYSYKDKTTGKLFRSSVRPSAKDPPKYWIQPGQKDIFTPGGETISRYKIGNDPSSGLNEKYLHEWSVQEVFITSVRFYKGHPLSTKELEEFENTVSQLNNPQKLIGYLNENFVIEERSVEETYTPQEFFKKKRGGIGDFAVFTSYVMAKNKITDPDSIKGYKYIERETGKEGVNFIVTIGRAYNYPFLTTVFFAPTGIDMYTRDEAKEYWTEMIQQEEKRLNIEVKEIGLLFWKSPNLLKDANWYKIIKISEKYYKLEPLTEVPPEY